MATFKPSHYQEAIFQWVTNGRGDAVVQACAGSGKTTTLVQAAQLLHSSRATFLAFNNHIVKELQERLGKSMSCKTIHSVGMGAVRRHLGKAVVDEEKYNDIAKPYAAEIADDLKREYQLKMRQWARSRDEDDVEEPEEPPNIGIITRQLQQLAHYTRVTLTAVQDFEEVEEMVNHFNCLDDSLSLKMLHYPLQSILREGERIAADRGIIDYDDMLWLPWKWELIPYQVDWVMADECLPGDSLVTLADGSQLPIQTIVENQIPVSVLCYNEQTFKVEAKPVIGWRKVPRRDRQIMQIGNLKATEDHPVYTEEFGYISMESALADGDVHVLVLDNEKVRSECAANGQGAVDYHRVAAWRCVNQQGDLEGQTRECQGKVYPRASTVTLPEVEAIGTSAMGRHSNINHATGDRVWWNRLSLPNSDSSSVYRDLSVNQTGRWQQADYTSIAAIPGRFSVSSLVHGRWNNGILGCSNSSLCPTPRRFGFSCSVSDFNWCYLQADEINQGAYPWVHSKWDAITRTEDYSLRSSGFNLQTRQSSGSNMRSVRREFSSASGFVFQGFSNVQPQLQRKVRSYDQRDISRQQKEPLSAMPCLWQQLQDQGLFLEKVLQQQLHNGKPSPETEEWVYCLDVADNHNFFANGILVHNCQDFSPAMLDLVLKMRGRGGRILFVADPKQAIMGFAGALNDSVDQIIKRTNATVLPLSICYRCPSKHIELAQKLVPTIEARPDAPEGIVEHIPYAKVSEMVCEGDLVISRCTAPAVKLCIELIAKRIPARVRGRDIGRALTAIVKEVAGHPEFRFKEFSKFLQEYQRLRIEKLMQRKNSESQIQSLRDRVDGIQVCYEAFNCNDIGEFCQEIEDLFSDGRASVLLSTVHRAKGLEERRVFILRPDQLPLRWPNQQDWQASQEKNLLYVALTRAKEALYFVAEDKPKKDESLAAEDSEIEDQEDEDDEDSDY